MAADQAWLLFSSLFLLLYTFPRFLDYQGTFQSCFHFGESYQTTGGGVQIPGDSHSYASHPQNGFHMSSSNTGAAGEARSAAGGPRLPRPRTLHLTMLPCPRSVTGFGLSQELQGGAGCQFSSSPEESIFFPVGSFERGLSHMSSVYTET